MVAIRDVSKMIYAKNFDPARPTDERTLEFQVFMHGPDYTLGAQLMPTDEHFEWGDTLPERVKALVAMWASAMEPVAVMTVVEAVVKTFDAVTLDSLEVNRGDLLAAANEDPEIETIVLVTAQFPNGEQRCLAWQPKINDRGGLEMEDADFIDNEVGGALVAAVNEAFLFAAPLRRVAPFFTPQVMADELLRMGLADSMSVITG